MGDECSFKLALREGCVVGNSQEFEDVRILDDVGGLHDAGFVVRGGEPALHAPSAARLDQPLVQRCRYLSFELAYRPSGFDAFSLVETPLARIRDDQKLAIMRPTQFNRQCLLFFICKIESSHELNIRYGEPLAVCLGQFSRQPLERCSAVLRAIGVCLLVFHYDAADIPVRDQHLMVHVRNSTPTPLFQHALDVVENGLVGCDFFIRHGKPPLRFPRMRRSCWILQAWYGQRGNALPSMGRLFGSGACTGSL